MTSVQTSIRLKSAEYNRLAYLSEAGKRMALVNEILENHAELGKLDSLEPLSKNGEDTTEVTLSAELPLELLTELSEAAKAIGKNLEDYLRMILVTASGLRAEVIALEAKERTENVRVMKGMSPRISVKGEQFVQFEKLFGKVKENGVTKHLQDNLSLVIQSGLEKLLAEKKKA